MKNVKHFIMKPNHMDQGLFLWKKKKLVDPWQMLKLDSIREIEKRVHHCPQKAGSDVYTSAITDYMRECRRFLPENDANHLEVFLLKQYSLE
ncbi:hypothetical protein HUG15_15470 [Salicibibacter cibarius]|uniref:Uncharacterized protein n=1 Tax=Salicibibacter cibarius TaxID=2743000 RepID=A0A7T6Z4U6_9BACI|nr:hypothetical protein [Salicibibacter cibarius]QQK76823.1 hypothetical protein HUG15_15470 [Salicibibacter cibarius]